MRHTRRAFCSSAAASLLTPRFLFAQGGGNAIRPDVAAIDHDRILDAAQRYLKLPPVPLTAVPSDRNPGDAHDFFSEADDWIPDPAAPVGPYIHSNRATNPAAFAGHSVALLNMSIYVPALTAAWVLTRTTQPDQAKLYGQHAVAHLRAWFVNPATRMKPALLYGQVIPVVGNGNVPASRFQGVIETVHLAEVAQAVQFLASSDALSEQDLSAVKGWFAEYLTWLTTSRLAGLARDQKDHHGTSWLLQTSAFTKLTAKDDAAFLPLRHQYQHVNIRAQMTAIGNFPHELTTPNPYRNSLFNLDMFAVICDLLSTRFESIWDYELQDGPGMRAAIAYHFPFIQSRNAWPYPSDSNRFTALPLRQPSLLLSARAYSRPEYAALWKTLPPDTTDMVLQRTFPIRQPLLWVTRPRP
jgi:Alginate lyase